MMHLQMLSGICHRLVAQKAPDFAPQLGMMKLAVKVLQIFPRRNGTIAIITKSFLQIARLPS